MADAVPPDPPLFQALRARGFDLAFRSHAQAILRVDFPDAADEIEAALPGVSIPAEELIASGGGEAEGTQRLGHALAVVGWRKRKFVVETRRDGVPSESRTDEIDHVRTTPNGHRLALEIEWNNTAPFFDRDRENFRRLHADGAISCGIIITRGRTLQDGLRDIVRRFIARHSIAELAQLAPWGYRPTPRQTEAIRRRADRQGFADAVADVFVSDTFGEATTHWRKLEERLARGVGNPCPLVLIGPPAGVVAVD